MSRRIRRLLLALSLVLVTWLAAGAVASWFLVSRRSPDTLERPPEWAREGWFEEVRLRTADGEELGAWFVPTRPEKGRETFVAKGVVLYLHGYSARRTLMNAHAAESAQEGYHAMSVSLRAHGDSTGVWNDLGWSARKDVLAAVEYIEKRAPGLPILIVGTSMGAAAAIFAAPELGGRVRAYWLNAPYRDLKSAAWDRCVRSFPPVFDALAYAGLRLWTPLLLEAAIEKIRPIDHVGRFDASVEVVFTVGEHDEESPPEDVHELVEKCTGQARLVTFENVGHEGLEARDFDSYMGLLFTFFGQVLE